MSVNQKRGNNIKSSIKSRKVTRKASGDQMITEEVSLG